LLCAILRYWTLGGEKKASPGGYFMIIMRLKYIV